MSRSRKMFKDETDEDDEDFLGHSNSTTRWTQSAPVISTFVYRELSSWTENMSISNVPDQDERFVNFIRLWHLIMRVCTDLFRDILSHYVKPADLRLEVDKHREKLENSLNSQQIKTLYSMKEETELSVTHMDFSLLHVLLRKICSIHFSTTLGNDPQKGERSIGACIHRIRLYRNMFLHLHRSVKEDEFEKNWDALKEDIGFLEENVLGEKKYRLKIELLRTSDLFCIPLESNLQGQGTVEDTRFEQSAVESKCDQKEQEMELLFDMVSKQLSPTSVQLLLAELLPNDLNLQYEILRKQYNEPYFCAMYVWYQRNPKIDHKEKLKSILCTLERQDIVYSISEFTKRTFEEFQLHNPNTRVDEHDIRLVCKYEIHHFRSMLRYLGLSQHYLDSIEIDYADNVQEKILTSLKTITSRANVTRIDLCSAIEYASQNRRLIKKLNSMWELK